MFKNIAGSISGLTGRMGPIAKVGMIAVVGFLAFKLIRGKM